MRIIAAIVSILMISFSSYAGTPAAKSDTDLTADDYIELQTLKRELLILGSSKDFAALKRDAIQISKKMHMRFSMNGHVCDPQHGLILPDGEWKGMYFSRRDHYDESEAEKLIPYISIEESSAYPGMAKGYFIIVAGVCDTKQDALKELKKFTKFVPDAYIKSTRIYYGCRL